MWWPQSVEKEVLKDLQIFQASGCYNAPLQEGRPPTYTEYKMNLNSNTDYIDMNIKVRLCSCYILHNTKYIRTYKYLYISYKAKND
jgi:hypothetical protein